MFRRTCLMLLLCAAPAYATDYTFSGSGGLSGSFYLDDSTPMAVSVDQSTMRLVRGHRATFGLSEPQRPMTGSRRSC